MKKNKPTISIITPLYNEEAVVPQLASRLKALFNEIQNIDWEWVAVDDGSSDATFEIISEAIKFAPNWQIIRFSRNFGQQAAYRAGVEKATGDAIIFLDADMQDPPEKIPEMFALWQKGFQHVVGCRRSRQETGIRGLCMKMFHEIFHRVTLGVMPKNSGTFALMDRKLADELVAMPERGMFLPAQRAWLGFKTAEIFYDRLNRAGEPKQSYSKLFSYAWEGVTSFSAIPLHLIFLIGLIVSVIGFSYAVILVMIKALQVFGFFSSLEVPGFTTISVGMLCLGGIHLLSIGVIGSYIAKIYQEVKRRPFFVISEHIDG